MSSEELEEIQILLHDVMLKIGLISIEDYEEMVESDRQEISRFETLGPIMDPTAYRDAVQFGEFAHQKAQVEIMKHLLEIRKQIGVMHKIHLTHITRSPQRRMKKK